MTTNLPTDSVPALAEPTLSVSPQTVPAQRVEPTRTAPPPGRMAVVNEWFEAKGGAERVLTAMLNAFPDADAHVLWKDADAVSDHHLRESWLARTPLRGRKSLTLPLIPLVWRMQRSERYDVVLSLSHALNHTARLPVVEGGVHLSYVHTPARYLWMPEIDNRVHGFGHRVAIAATKRLELTASKHVSSYAANSAEVQRRIHTFWGRESRVIHPPVRTEFFSQTPLSAAKAGRDYLIGVGRWTEYKNFDFMIEVAARAGLPLVLAGGGPCEGKLRAQAARLGADVRFELRISDERLRELLWGARCLLFPCHEDFGIVPVEAQACGTPVVGLARGGLLETVSDGETGYLLEHLDVASFASRVRDVAKLDPAAAIQLAHRFREERFAHEVRAWVAAATS